MCIRDSFRPYAGMIQGYRALAKEALMVTIRKMYLIKCVQDVYKRQIVFVHIVFLHVNYLFSLALYTAVHTAIMSDILMYCIFLDRLLDII